MNGFTGIWVALVTPFQGGEVDYRALQTLARSVRDAGAAGLVVCGSTGEAAALGQDEQMAVLDAVLEAVPDCPVVMGLAGNNLQDVQRRLEEIQGRPVAGVLAPPPYYIRPSQQGLIAYFRTLADASSVPIILYNIPYRTGIGLDLETIRAIAQHPRIAAIKDCGGNPMLTMQLIADARLAVLAGEDNQIFTTLCLGGAGAITAAANIRPDLYVRMANAVINGELDEGRRLFYCLLPLIDRLFKEPNPGPVKAALAQLKFIRDELRAPMQPASAGLRNEITIELDRLKRIPFL
ncbi:MAG: 4-hydroxy-tetrahydrodipicolinate synthase [Burkholderiales bacterium]|jgi:4-hydroxy-tetrahydrodipicolinate synthase